jgi:hypothetical protein
VPAPVFLEREQLEWDGATGFLDREGRRAFANPSTDGWDPVAFVIHADFLRRFLREHKFVALWIEQVMRTAISDGPPGRQYIDTVRCHVSDGEEVRTVVKRTIELHLVDPKSKGQGS